MWLGGPATRERSRELARQQRNLSRPGHRVCWPGVPAAELSAAGELMQDHADLSRNRRVSSLVPANLTRPPV